MENVQTALTVIGKLLEQKQNAVIAIEGRCGAGKTTFAALCAERFGAEVIHTDDFYLPFAKRALDWTKIPGGNMDFARFNEEIALPIRRREGSRYRKYNCRKNSFSEPIELIAQGPVIVEGSYGRHPEVQLEYDLSIYLTCSQETQKKRLEEREGSYYPAFEAQWIPAEESYSKICSIIESSDLVVCTE